MAAWARDQGIKPLVPVEAAEPGEALFDVPGVPGGFLVLDREDHVAQLLERPDEVAPDRRCHDS
jgi:hypothetical protein